MLSYLSGGRSYAVMRASDANPCAYVGSVFDHQLICVIYELAGRY